MTPPPQKVDVPEDVTKRTYRQHNTKRGYEFFIDTIPYKYGQCAGRVWIDVKKGLSHQCTRRAGGMDGYFCKQHRKQNALDLHAAQAREERHE